MKLKLSNFLNNIDVFLNTCYLESECEEFSILTNGLEEINYENNENKIKLLNYVLDNFFKFQMIFVYSENEFDSINEQLKINKSIILNKLITDYKLIDNSLIEIQQKIQETTDLISSTLNKKLNHLKEDYLLNLEHISNSNKYSNTCVGFSRYLAGVYKLSLGLTLQIGKLIYGSDQTYIMENHRIKDKYTIEQLIIVIDKILERKLNILKNPDNLI